MNVVMDGKKQYFTGEKRRAKAGRTAIMTPFISDAKAYKSEYLASKAAEHLNESEGRTDYVSAIMKLA